MNSDSQDRLLSAEFLFYSSLFFDVVHSISIILGAAGPNLRRAILGQPLQPFVPQKEFLSIIGCGDRYGVLSRGPWALEGRWVWTLKVPPPSYLPSVTSLSLVHIISIIKAANFMV